MENISDIEAYRRKRKKKKQVKRLVAFLVILLLIAAIAVVSLWLTNRNSDGGEDDGFFTETTLVPTGIEANGYPISVGGSNPLDIAGCGKSLFLLTKNNLLAFNTKGKQIYTAHHGYSKPVMSASEKRVLVYDQGGYQFRLDSSKSAMGSKKLAEKIVTGAVSNAGYVAIVTQTERYTIRLTVFDSGLKEILNWTVSDAVITGIDFNSNSSACVVSVFSAEGGTAASRVYELSLKKSGAERFKTELTGCMALSVDYKSNGNITVITDEKIVLLNSGGTVQKEWSYTGNLGGYENQNGKDTVLLLKEGGFTQVLLFDANGNQLTSAATEEQVIAVRSDGSKVTLLTENTLVLYDYELVEQKRSEAEIGPMQCVLIGGHGYVLSAGSLTRAF